MKKLIVFVCLLGLIIPFAEAQQWARPDAGYRWVNRQDILAKNYYLVSLLNNSPEMRNLITGDSLLKSVAIHKYRQLLNAKSQEDQLDAFRFSASEIQSVGERLEALCQEGNAWDRLVSNHLIPSGAYILSKATSSSELLRAAWEQDAEGINYAIDVYGGGKKPNYPKIDSISFDVQTPYYSYLLTTCRENIELSCKGTELFFDVPLTSVRMLLDINGRSETVDYEPLAETVNKSSYTLIRETNWNRYPYSVILVLGAGPEEEGVAISPDGKLRSQYAAELYFQGMAPFIMVSGGRVHPYKTPFSEANEMKNYLIETCHVPESAIIMEPHARHTTTNVRNAVRILFRQGVPMDKCALMTSSVGHISSVENTAFEKRCLRELNMKPYRLGKRLSSRLIEFYPALEALQINPLEPLDP